MATIKGRMPEPHLIKCSFGTADGKNKKIAFYCRGPQRQATWLVTHLGLTQLSAKAIDEKYGNKGPEDLPSYTATAADEKAFEAWYTKRSKAAANGTLVAKPKG